VRIAGQRITRRDEATRAGLRARWIGMLMQSGNLIEHLSVAQNIRAAQALVPRESGGDGRPRTRRRSRATQDGPSGPGAQHVLADVGLADRAGARPSTLSGGEAARAGLAVAMANDPPVLLADEPTGEIDREAEARVLELLRSRADRGKAVLVVTHSAIVAAAADRVVRMVDGRIADE
jgi:putative ABC transport system ATP-binding protein